MVNVLRFKQSNVPRQQGELARLKVIQGPDYGSIFVLIGPKVTIGRGEDNDIMISDLKASRNHAEFAMSQSGWIVKDTKSTNGILFNGKTVRQSALKLGDIITIGETSLEFVPAEAGTMMLMAPPKAVGQVQSEQAALVAQREKVRALGSFGGGITGIASTSASNGGGLFKNKKVLMIGAAALGVLLLFDTEDPKTKGKSKKKAQDARDLASYLPSSASEITNKTAEMFFRAGFREYRERNYLRAKSQFETVLQMSPGHPLATLYLENSNLAIEDEVKFHLDRGKKSLVAGKLKESQGHFEAILRLLYRDTTNPNYKEALSQIKVIKKVTFGKTLEDAQREVNKEEGG